jgi:hypothetical protein
MPKASKESASGHEAVEGYEGQELGRTMEVVTRDMEEMEAAASRSLVSG